VTARALFFALSFGACALAGAADPAADLCADTRIPKPMVQRADSTPYYDVEFRAGARLRVSADGGRIGP
jgi:hypothetical protein